MGLSVSTQHIPLHGYGVSSSFMPWYKGGVYKTRDGGGGIIFSYTY